MAGQSALEETMKRIGIIGLGSMGLAMAKNIIDSGFELTG
ncbi:MAG: NAD(P)-binding domain-containing protein, partial [Thermoanaerobaculia bacterium]